MKKVFLFSLVFFFLFACKKNAGTNTNNQFVAGVLTYSEPALDGAGLTYTTSGGEILLFRNEIPGGIAPNIYYKDLLGVPTILTFQDTGELGCTAGMIPCDEQKKLRVVDVVNLVKE